MRKGKKIKKPICLIILDGWGISDQKEGNAVYIAKTPNMDNYYKIYPNTKLGASGEAVGLPDGQMGNSEVGHLNIGAGRVVLQEFTRITKSIKVGDFFKNKVFAEAINNAKQNNSSLHIMGLVSDGGVHSHISHLKALIDLAYKNKVKNLYIHAFLDGRDVPPRSAIPYLEEIDKYLAEKGVGQIATVSGRYYAMDRDNRWDRTKKAYDAMVNRKGSRHNKASDVVGESYKKDVDDEFVVPAIVNAENEDKAKIKTGDSVIFFNFRPDRARQITQAFVDSNFDKFKKEKGCPDVYFACMTQYNKNFDVPVAFPPRKITNTLGEVLSKNNKKQLRIAETEKYAHVTFFFNGGVEKSYEGEDRILIPSPKVATYNLKPEMSAYEVTDNVVEKIQKKKYDVIILNYANTDMVGHTGYFDAAVKAVEVVDKCVGAVVCELDKLGGVAIIISDHGNVEKMMDPADKSIITAHSTSPVPFILCDKNIKKLREDSITGICRLCDVAPTILDLLDIKKPEEMTGSSLIESDV